MRLLVSVRNAEEARAALAGGAEIIDAKEPSRGALGAVDDRRAARDRRAVDGMRPVSAALGDVGRCGCAGGVARARRPRPARRS